MKDIFLHIACILLLILANGCGERAMIRKTMADFMRHEIVIPDDLECLHRRKLQPILKDTLKQGKLIIYLDSLDCMSCHITELVEYVSLHEMADTCDFSILTIFSPPYEDIDEIKKLLMIANHSTPIFIDTYGSFKRQNRHIPIDSRFHSFLINGQGKPVFIGNPTTDTKLMELFLHALNNLN